MMANKTTALDQLLIAGAVALLVLVWLVASQRSSTSEAIVTPVALTPPISALPEATTPEDTPVTIPLPRQITEDLTEPTFTASSSNPILLPNQNIRFEFQGTVPRACCRGQARQYPHRGRVRLTRSVSLTHRVSKCLGSHERSPTR